MMPDCVVQLMCLYLLTKSLRFLFQFGWMDVERENEPKVR
jgi:hypothetical protein